MLKNKILASSLASLLMAATLLFTSCVPENVSPDADLPKGAIRLVAPGYQSPNGSKLGVDEVGKDVFFAAGDLLWVNGVQCPISVNENGVAYFVRPEGVEYPLRIVYPYGIVDNNAPTNSDNIPITLPAEYTYATVQDGPGAGRQNVPAPLCAKIVGTGEGQIPDSAFFKHITAAITVAVKNASSIPIYIKNLEVKNATTTGCLCAQLTVNVQNPQVTRKTDDINATTDKYKIEMTFLPQGACRVDAGSVGYIQIPILPLQSMGRDKDQLDFVLKASPASDDLIPFEMYYQRTQNGTTGFTIARSQLAYVPIELDPNDRSDVENGVCERAKLHYKIDGVFSISGTEKVYFSRGNLKYKIGSDATSNASWKFFPDQDSSHALTEPASSSKMYLKNTYQNHPGIDGWVDLFLFGANGNSIQPQKLPHAVSSVPSSPISPSDNDWGCRVGDGQWFTLSEDQWSYLLGTRTMFAPNGTLNEGRFAVAIRRDDQGNDRYVLVIFPDKYWVQTSQVESVASEEVIDDAKYAKLQAAGVAILPATGKITNGSGRDRNYIIWNGLSTFYYWTSDYKQLKQSSNAYQFGNGEIFSSAVRLVRNAAHSNNQSNN